MKVISIFNQKGGVGKTTTVVNLATALSKKDKKVLVIDLDPQANTTTGLGFNKNNLENSIYDLFYRQDLEYEMKKMESEPNLKNKDEDLIENFSENINNNVEYEKNNEKINIDEYIRTTKEKVSLIASESSLSGLEVELVYLDEIERTKQLLKIIKLLDEKYDIVLIDCPPSLGLLSINALVASNSIIIPIQTEYYALEGVSDLLKTYDLVKEALNKDIDIEGVLLTMFDKRTKLSYEVAEEVKAFFKSKVFKTMIPKNIKLAEAPSFGKSAISYDDSCNGARAYKQLAEEIIENIQNEKNFDKNMNKKAKKLEESKEGDND